jgi:hypothetical protein
MVFIQLCKLGLDPMSALRTFKSNPASEFLAMGHVARVGGREQEDWVGEGPTMQYVVDDVKLIQRNLWQRGLFVGRIRTIGRDNERDIIMGGDVDEGNG